MEGEGIMIEANTQIDGEAEIELSSLEIALNHLPLHWHVLKLGEVCSDSKMSIDPQDYPDELFEYYSIPAFQDHNEALITRGSDIMSVKLIVENNTVLFGKLNPRVLKVWFVDSMHSNRKIASTEFIPLCPNKQAYSKYIYYLCQSRFVVLLAQKLVSGSTPSRQRVDTRAFFQISVPIPPLSEQRAIAHILQTTQNAIQARRKELDLEHERKAALMQNLFVHGTRGEATKQTEVGEIPESWTIRSLGEISQFLQYGTSEPCYADMDGIPVLRIPNVIHGYIHTRDLKYIILPEKIVGELRLEAGDLLFVRTNGNRAYTGRCAVFNGELKDALFASYLIRLRLQPGVALPKFIQFYTMTQKGIEYLSGKASNAADGKYNINTQTIKRTLVPLPSLEEEREIVETLNSCDSKIASLEKEIALQEELFRTLLEELMSGRLSALPLVE